MSVLWVLSLSLLSQPHQSWANGHFVLQVEAPQAVSAAQAEEFLAQLETARAEVSRVLAPVLTPTQKARTFDVTVCRDTQTFARRSGRQWHSGAAVVRDRLYTQPWKLMQRYRNIDATLRHEIVHLWLNPLIREAPRWFVEGTAMVVAAAPPPGMGFTGPLGVADLASLDGALVGAKDRRTSEAAYRKAYAAVRRIASKMGMQGFVQRLSQIKAQGMGALGEPAALDTLVHAD